MQPSTPRSYDLAVPTGDYPRKTLMPVGRDAPEPYGEFKSRLLDLTTAPSRHGCAHSI